VSEALIVPPTVLASIDPINRKREPALPAPCAQRVLGRPRGAPARGPSPFAYPPRVLSCLQCERSRAPARLSVRAVHKGTAESTEVKVMQATTANAMSSTNFDELPTILRLEEARLIVGVGKAAWYRALRRNEIPGAFQIGGQHLVLRDVLVTGLGQRTTSISSTMAPDAQPLSGSDAGDAQTGAVVVRALTRPEHG
jgi:predicted DNA-binding transcriptional regulator AlpA